MGLLRQIRYFGSVIREAKKDLTRSSHWPTVRKAHLKKFPSCAACGSTNKLQVHHVEPFHLHPELELFEDNLLTLCMDRNECHLLVGHGGDYHCYNPQVRSDAGLLLKDPGRRTEVVNDAKAKRLKDDD